MNELQVFNNPEFGRVRTTLINDEPYFVGKDVAEILGYERPTKAISDHVDTEDRDAVPIQDSIGRMQNTPVINESGLYSLILSSKLPTAKKFKRWVTSEVLPSIRKTGTYNVNSKTEKMLEIKEANARVRLSNQFLKLSKVDTLSHEYKNILVSKATEVLTGARLLPLPMSEQKMYSATEIGNLLGVSAKRIGHLSNQYGLKTSQYGTWYRSKSQYSNKEVDTFMYNDKALEQFKKLVNQKAS